MSACPSRDEFLAAVERRGASLSLLSAAATPRRFEVVLAQDGEGYVGTLVVDDAVDGRTDERTVRGGTCEEIAEALSLTVALELNEATAAREGASSAEQQPLAEDGRAHHAEPDAPPPRTPRTASSWGHQVTDVTNGKLHVAPRFVAAVSAGLSFGLFPSLVTRYDATLRMASFVTLPSGERKLVGPILRGRLGFVGAPQKSWDLQGTSVTISGQSMGLGLCWSPLYEAAGLTLLGCGELSLGGYSTRVQAPEGDRRDSPVTLLGGIGPLVEAEYGLGPLRLVARVGGNWTFGTVEAQRADGGRLFRSERWEGFFALGLGGHW